MNRLVELSPLGTRHWRSYALFRAGADCAAAGNHDAAERLFIDSLREDKDHTAALVNFAGELLVVREGKDIDFAIAQLEKVVREYGGHANRHRDPVYYAALYRL